MEEAGIGSGMDNGIARLKYRVREGDSLVVDLDLPDPVQRMCWGLWEVVGEVTGVAALGCVNFPRFSPGCGCCANRDVTAVGERCDRGILLSTGGGCSSLKVRGM